jgi:2-C-methyl-D-erythritol 4-phosphate cytidylyltransferase / 2-C-methyl-D-erythritol 2,4-cyclodiphosphate synthase
LKKVSAILVAGGRGERFTASEGLPKQFLLLEGEPVYVWSLRVFCQHQSVDGVVLVVVKDLMQAFQEGVQKYLPEFVGKIKFAQGGAVRQSSVLSGLEYLARQENPPKLVLIHDAVRPFVDSDDLDKVIDGLAKSRGCVLAVPVLDTVKQVEDGLVVGTTARQGLFLMQTPQGADFSALLTAHRDLARAGIETTDDAAVLEQAGIPVNVVTGSPRNFKITTPEDFYLAQALAARLTAEKKSSTTYSV